MSMKSPIITVTVNATRTDLYTCPPNTIAKVPLIFISNSGSNTTIGFEIYKASDTSYHYIISGKNMSGGDYLQLSSGYIILSPGDKLVVTATGTPPTVTALCTVEEEYRANNTRAS